MHDDMINVFEKGWMDGWMDGWMEGWMCGWIYGQTDGWMDGWIYGQMDVWTDRWIDCLIEILSQDLCWEPFEGRYLLSVSGDQTTRLHSIWNRSQVFPENRSIFVFQLT